MVKVGVVTVVYSGYPHVLFDGILNNTAHEIQWYIHCHSADRVLENHLAAFCIDRAAELNLHRWNRGLSRSWNDGILASYADECDYTVVINDDISFIPGGFDRFITFLSQQGRFGLGFIQGRETSASPYAGAVLDQGFACFGFGIRAYQEIGAFDENFFPAYSEDIDYVTRARSAGIPIALHSEVLVEHARNHTTNTAPELRAAMSAFKQANSLYFAEKWGGAEQAPVHTRPWGKLPLRIDWADRHTPYGPDYDRLDAAELEGTRPKLRSTVVPYHERNGADPPPSVIDRNGMDVATATIRTIYKTLLNREPEPAALTAYAKTLFDGRCTVDELIGIVRSSKEYGLCRDAREQPVPRDSD